MSVKSKLLKRIMEQFPNVDENTKITRCYPTSAQREAGAFLWIINEHDIGSVFTMSDCVKAESWDISYGPHYKEIWPKSESK